LCQGDLVIFSVPLFESIARAVALFDEVRKLDSEVPVVFFGTYATLNASTLLARGASGVILGDWEDVLVEVAARVAKQQPLDAIGGLATPSSPAQTVFHRSHHLKPDRSDLPALSSYSYPETIKRLGDGVIVGNVESARGCRFACSYCSVFASIRQKVTVFQEEIVLQDIEQLVEKGAKHICFTDAEFLNAPSNALRVAATLHERFPFLTFDFTTRADLIVEDPSRIQRLVELGGKFVTTAFEFPNQTVLNAINKQFTVDTLECAIRVCRAAGIGINPTFLLFNPWVSFEDLNTFSEFLSRNDLEDQVEPVQLATRLWLYKGSPLLADPRVKASITKEHLFNFEWRHADPDVERLFEAIEKETNGSGVVKRCCLKC
jgi:radical SAM superfamily enzyme YgiQ (UPF0313 family)